VYDVIGLIVVCLVVLAGYFEIPFEGKTFSTSSYVPSARVCNTPSGACRAAPLDDPRVDYGASSWALEPWVDVVHRDLAQHDIPLWNSYQGIGAPLAGNMQSSAFDPVMLAVHLHPTPLLEDLTLLAGLMLIGMSAYWAARMLRLGVVAAVLAGSAYALSGWFFSYSNNEWFRIYMFLPLIIGGVEWVIRSRSRLAMAALACFITGLFLTGMPEPAFMSLVAAGVFAAVRVFIGERAGEWWRAVLRLAAGGAVGLALAAPLLALFREYVPLSFNIHANLSDKPPATDPLTVFLNWMMPRISPTLPSSTTPIMQFSYTRNWVGAGVMVLAALALLTSQATKRKHAVWPVVAVGTVLTVQIYGGGLVAETRHLPVWSQALWPAFGTPIIALVLSLLAGVGVQAIADRVVRIWQPIAALAIVVALALWAVLAADHFLAFGSNGFIRGGWPVAAFTAVALVVVACIPAIRRWAPAIIVALVIIELVVIAPRDLYAPRENQFPTTALTTYLTDHTGDGSRIFSTDGVLFPDSANAYGLSDLRMLDALYPDRYWNYVRTFISHGIADRLIATGPTESAPAVAANPMFDILGVRYLLYKDSLNTGPPSWSDPQYKLVHQADGVKIYENTHAAPRAFVVPQVHTVANEQQALDFFTDGEPTKFPDGSVQVTERDPRQEAVVESGSTVAGGADGCTERPDAATIRKYTSNTVELAVNSQCGGLLVLSDEYYPGWTATVNGKSATVYPTDVALRGVSVPAGRSTVTFHYRPSSFRLGIVAFLIGFAALVFLVVTGIGATAWWRRRRGDPSPRDPAGQPA
jgi:hypothetical protein